MIRTYRALPPIVSGYPLESGGRSWFSVIVPIARTNEVTNPSAELGTTTNYTTGAGTLTASTEQQYHGAYSFKYVPSAATTDGFYYTLTSTVAIRAISCKFRGAAGVPYALTYATSAGVDLVTKTFIGTGRWQWIHLYYNDASATTRRLYFRKNGSVSVAPYYVDGVQSEVINAGELVSTFISGDELGLLANQSPPPFYWTGLPNASTSVRTALTRAGGMVVPLHKYNFLLTAIIGLGLATPQNVATEYARIDGSYPDYTRKPTRQFSLTGRFQARTPSQLDRDRGGLSALLDRDLSALDQELLLRYERLDANDSAVSDAALLRAKYVSGLGGNADNHFAETAALTFVQYLPTVRAEGGAGASLSVQLSISNTHDILQRSPDGVWATMGTGSSLLSVQSLGIGLDGKVYAGGFFAQMGGVANTNHIAYWEPTTGVWNAMGTGAAAGANAVYNFAIGPDGAVYAMGDFTQMGGVANTASLAKWNGSAWSSITAAGSANGSVLSAVFDSSGNLYVAGNFTTINGVAANRIAKMDTAGTWTALSTGLNSVGQTLIVDAADNIYVGGSFTTPTTRVAKWNGSAFSALGSGLDNTVRALTFGPNGIIYAGGDFANSGSDPVARIARFNGITWSPLGSGLAGGVVTDLEFNGTSGQLFIGGTFTSSNGRTLPDSLAIWTGADFVYADIDLPASAQVNAIKFAIDGTMYIGFDQQGTAITGSTTTITNTGTARSYPTITIKGPSSGTARIWSILNTTTGRSIFLNYTMNVGETATLVFTPDNLKFTSDFAGNIASKILPGSSEAEFFLQPGANTIAFLSASSTVTATISWQRAFARLDDLTR